jgi:phosphate transport system protein
MTASSSSLKPHFLEDIATLKDAIMSEGDLVKSRLARAIKGLIEKDVDVLDEVTMGDAEVNAQQIAIDDRAFKLLALHQPVAVDLRVIVAAIKINSDLERVGDLAVNVAEATRRYFGTGQTIELKFLPRMADIAQAMLESALQAFVSGSLGLAQSVLERDDALDSLRVQAYRRLVDLMASDGGLVPSALELLSVARHLERIGDHATNIAEDVFFIVAGEDVRIQTLGGPGIEGGQP